MNEDSCCKWTAGMPLERKTVNSFRCDLQTANSFGHGEWVRVKSEGEFNSQPFVGGIRILTHALAEGEDQCHG
jgi:hypothetical protein